ncbi:MAG: gfo/Idh/MocA family oxidoreductase, partial [Planctomycetaceae bacterium]|nr:gfo/Idh/MocA family oxidoreductase [Planctomycetaceae bacterium]
LGATDTGPSKVTPIEYTLPVKYKDGHPVVADQYNTATAFEIKVDMPNGVEMIIKSAGDNGILFEGTKGRFFVNRGKIVGKPVDALKENPLPEDAIEKVYGGKVSANHTANFIEGIKARKQPISDVWSHNRMLEICHLSNIAMRLGRAVKWDPSKREIIGDDQANAFLSREYRKGYEIEM